MNKRMKIEAMARFLISLNEGNSKVFEELHGFIKENAPDLGMIDPTIKGGLHAPVTVPRVFFDLMAIHTIFAWDILNEGIAEVQREIAQDN